MKACIHHPIVAALLLATAFHVAPASAALTLQGTRVIYPAEKREVTVRLNNSSEHASIVQAWIDDGDASATPSTANAPFVIRPPIFRVDPGRAQLLRVSAVGENMPQDRESLFWFNAREVPVRKAGQTLQAEGAQMHFIVRTRVKLLYRPKGLSEHGARQAPQALNWALQSRATDCTLVVTNPTPYNVNLNKVNVERGAIDIGSGIVAPMGETRFNLSSMQCAGMKGRVAFEFVNDHGGVRTHETALTQN